MYLDLDDEKEEVGILVLEMLEQGCWTREEIVSNLRDELDELDDVAFNAVINEQVVEKVKAEARYPETTDCDRFYRAFDALSEGGSLALHCPGSTFTRLGMSRVGSTWWSLFMFERHCLLRSSMR